MTNGNNSIICIILICIDFLHRRFKGGMIEPHPTESSIIVNYKLEAAVYGDKDISDPMLADKKVNK